MARHEFTLRVRLPDPARPPQDRFDALGGTAGCLAVDAGSHAEEGTVLVEFARDTDTLDEAVASAVSDVLRVVPGAAVTGASRGASAEARGVAAGESRLLFEALTRSAKVVGRCHSPGQIDAVRAQARREALEEAARLAEERAARHRDRCAPDCRCADGWHIAAAIRGL